MLAVAEKHQIKPSHANWLEAFPFNIVGELPDEEKVPPRVPGIMDAEEARRVYGDGSFGGRYQVEASIMQEIFEAALLDILPSRPSAIAKIRVGRDSNPALPSRPSAIW